MNRRSFITKASLFAAGATALTVVPVSLLGATPQAPRREHDPDDPQWAMLWKYHLDHVPVYVWGEIATGNVHITREFPKGIIGMMPRSVGLIRDPQWYGYWTAPIYGITNGVYHHHFLQGASPDDFHQAEMLPAHRVGLVHWSGRWVTSTYVAYDPENRVFYTRLEHDDEHLSPRHIPDAIRVRRFGQFGSSKFTEDVVLEPGRYDQLVAYPGHAPIGWHRFRNPEHPANRA